MFSREELVLLLDISKGVAIKGEFARPVAMLQNKLESLIREEQIKPEEDEE